jgi:hypothetical protein
MSKIEGCEPPRNIEKIWGDYNAVGLSVEEDDNCIYSLHREMLGKLSPKAGMRLFVYDEDISDDGALEIFGYVCVLENIDGFISQWRARPEQKTWYRGPKTW